MNFFNISFDYELILLIEIFLTAFRVRLDGGFVLLLVPVGWTDFAVLVNELESFDQAKSFIDGSADGKVVDRNLTHNLVRVDDEQASERDSCVVQQHAVVA